MGLHDGGCEVVVGDAIQANITEYRHRVNVRVAQGIRRGVRAVHQRRGDFIRGGAVAVVYVERREACGDRHSCSRDVDGVKVRGG